MTNPLEEYGNEDEFYKATYNRLEDKIDKLEVENKKLREALGFYADEGNYIASCPSGLVQCKSNEVFFFKDGGKKAREVLK